MPWLLPRLSCLRRAHPVPLITATYSHPPDDLFAAQYGNEEYIQNVAANLIESINKSGTVSRVIFTSSTAGVAGPTFDPNDPGYGTGVVMYEDRYYDEDDPGRKATRETSSAYSVTKVKSEFLFAAGAEASGGQWESITLNPSDNVGPILSPHQVRHPSRALSTRRNQLNPRACLTACV
jgi:nucleoside-diphosphate-sugar epimerase